MEFSPGAGLTVPKTGSVRACREKLIPPCYYPILPSGSWCLCPATHKRPGEVGLPCLPGWEQADLPPSPPSETTHTPSLSPRQETPEGTWEADLEPQAKVSFRGCTCSLLPPQDRCPRQASWIKCVQAPRRCFLASLHPCYWPSNIQVLPASVP